MPCLNIRDKLFKNGPSKICGRQNGYGLLLLFPISWSFITWNTKDTTEKFKSEIKLFQAGTERYKQLISKTWLWYDYILTNPFPKRYFQGTFSKVKKWMWIVQKLC